MLINNEDIDEKVLPDLLEDFSQLRERALTYIQQTNFDKWTDHNIHDPGITIMEALCYALSDLGFRMKFSMQDLIADQSGKLPEKAFYYAQDILPSHAVTISDIRKILIDLPLVRNAWITPVTEEHTGISLDYEPMYIYRKEGKLFLEKQLKQRTDITPSELQEILSTCQVFIHGLYAINIEFEPQPLLGNIDSGEAFEAVFHPEFFGELFYDISNWNDLINDRFILEKIAQDFIDQKIRISIRDSLKNKYNNNDGKLYERVLKEWYLNIDVKHIVDQNDATQDELVATLEDVLFQPFSNENKGIKGQTLLTLLQMPGFFTASFQKIQALSKAYKDVRAILHTNRNLCEDFLPQISAIPTIEFRICADIDVSSKIDIEQVQAIIFHKIEEYISPSINFRSYSELAAKGYAIEEILEGPKLVHGFILDEDMGENSFQNFTINLSDIINVIYETEGLINCRNVQLFLKDDNGITIPNESKWVIKVPAGYKPVLNKRKSKLLFYKNDLPLLANFKESMLKLSLLKKSSIKYSNANVPAPLLNPTYRDLAVHYSIANEFPATYKVGKNFPDKFLNRPELFTSKQLEGYLLLFDQVIANFLKDLYQLKLTLSWNTVQHINHVSTDNEWRRPYLLGSSGDTKWQNIIESPRDFYVKRNESLDYLLARFAEDLQEIDNYFYLSTDNLKINEGEYYDYLIKLKQRFLSNYITISANRGAAINLFENRSYFQTAPSGYENRISNLLGCELLKDGIRKKVDAIAEGEKGERGYFHVLEHILLRIPISNETYIMDVEGEMILKNVELLSVCADDDCTACSGDDPYSFTASVALPAWIPVYGDVHYRDFVERLIRRETPAGVLLRICWLDKESMGKYEAAIDKWWSARYDLLLSGPDDYQALFDVYLLTQNEFAAVLKSQRSSYFPATLHGCEDEEEENNTRVFLNKTFLG